MSGVETLKVQVSFDGKQAIAGYRELKQSQFNLTEEIKKYQSLAFTEKDGAKVATYNRRVQELQATLKQTTVIGKQGFDEMGVAIEKASGNPLGKAFSGLRQIAYLVPGIGIAGIFNLAFEAIGKAAQAMGIFSTKASEAEKNLKNLNDVQKEADKQAGQDLTKARLLYQATQDVNLSMRDRLRAAQELKNEYPELLKNFSAETIAAGGAKSAYDNLTQSIVANAKAKAAATKIGELQAKILDAEFKAEKIRNALSNELTRAKSYDTGGEANTTITAEQQRQDSFNRASKGFEQLAKDIKSYREQQQFLENSIGKQDLERGIIGFKTPKGIDKLSDAEKAYKKLNETIDELVFALGKGIITNEKFNSEGVKAMDEMLPKLKDVPKLYDKINEKVQAFGGFLREDKKLVAEVFQQPFLIDDLRKQRENRLHPDPDFVDKLAKPPTTIRGGESGRGSGVFDEDFTRMAEKNKRALDAYNEALKYTNFLTNSLGDSFYNAIEAGQNLGETLRTVFIDLAKQIGKALIKALLFQAIGSALGIVSGGVFGKGFGDVFKGLLGLGSGHAGGALTDGPRSGHIELLHGKEWVLRPEQLDGALNIARKMGSMQGSLANGAQPQALPTPHIFMKGSDFWLMYQQSQRLNQRGY